MRPWSLGQLSMADNPAKPRSSEAGARLGERLRGQGKGQASHPTSRDVESVACHGAHPLPSSAFPPLQKALLQCLFYGLCQMKHKLNYITPPTGQRRGLGVAHWAASAP